MRRLLLRFHKGVAMTHALARPAEFFDHKYGMDTTSLQHVLGKTLGKQIDYADLYFQYEVSDAVSLEEGLVKQASKHVNQGVGVRAVAGEKTGYAFSDEITVSTLEIAAHTARQIASSGAETASVAIRGRSEERRVGKEWRAGEARCME